VSKDSIRKQTPHNRTESKKTTQYTRKVTVRTIWELKKYVHKAQKEIFKGNRRLGWRCTILDSAHSYLLFPHHSHHHRQSTHQHLTPGQSARLVLALSLLYIHAGKETKACTSACVGGHTDLSSIHSFGI